VSDTDLVVPTLLSDVFGQGTGAFLLVAMVAAAMSSLDSVLLVMASTTERDVVSILRPGRSE
ncbi:MAG: sodium/proline symporter, partial [Gemmatimonadetes bacterium]|nr:sodium/proline symporter [Gemmatimonadota bacterium]NIT86650.1 sodium/proline symporter [Gemmatimonadota bacterium]NIU30503.1 sodium/proline symporter [Gemmatimonadota bacterium]NIV60873.1 sodium/proline symporter [Gemmatimonadota bacterium]NIW63568.1 sodium/proline symporter [Gemmatimonadota bacterium]